ncbi:MAG TPA: transglycosylase SLT domain-containing protein [Thermoanaerobaculia bacterium]
MRRRKLIRYRAALVLLVPLILGATTSPPARSTAASAGSFPGHSDRASLAYAEAAGAARRKDCATAYKALQPVLAGKGSEASFAQVLLGLYAHSCGQTGYAEERLFAAVDPDGELEDWRLYTLGGVAAVQGHFALAQASLAKLLGDYPGSVLRPLALLRAARLSWERGDAGRALELIQAARSEELPAAEAMELETLAWEIGTSRGNADVRAEAARRLLVSFPSRAAELQVVEVFRDGRGGPALDWASVLTADQLQRRAQSLLDMKLAPSALTTLDAVSLGERDLDWYLLKARALTAADRGTEALELLAGKEASQPRQAAALAWERAMAAEDAATAQRGRANLGSAERERFRLLSQQYLDKVAQIGADPDLAAKALKSLYGDYQQDELFDRAVETLRRLRRVDPRDTTGAAHLWQAGWREYGKANYTGAIGYWTELYALYPEDSSARRGRYWTGRAFDALGESERAQQIYNDIIQSDTTDFYRRSALGRLRGKPAALAAAVQAAKEPWPSVPALERARLLSDLGLEDLAAAETELVRGKVPERSLKALEATILARRGDRRKSVLVIRDAFPSLGGPFQASVPDEARRLYYPVEHQDTIRTWAAQNRLPNHLVMGIIRQESAFDTNAQSWAGARGLMQLMPATARELAVKNGLVYSHDKLSDPAFNVRLGTTYFRQVFNMFDENLELSLAGYNGGPYRIKRLWNESGNGELDRFLEGLGIEESKTYVKRILVLSDSYRQLYPNAG